MNVAYLRVSTQEQDARQTQETQRAVIKDSGLAIDEWIVEQQSGAEDDRPQFQRVLKDIESGRIKSLTVKSLDRLARSLITSLQTVKLFKEKGISFHAVDENIHIIDGKVEPTTELYYQIRSVFAEHERGVIRERTLSGKRRKQSQGLWVTGQPPVGYELDRVSKVLQINEREADLVRRIFDLRLNHVGINAILRKFNKESERFPEQKVRFSGVRHCQVAQKPRKSAYCRIRPYQQAFQCCNQCMQEHGGVAESQELWSKTSITKILKSKVYLGRINSKGQWIQGAHNPIIPVETFEAVQKLIAESTHKKERTYPANPLAGMVFCNQCGRPMHVTSSTSKRSPYIAFRCVGNRAGTCGQKNVKSELIYDQVYEALGKYWQSSAMLKTLETLYKRTAENYDLEVTHQLNVTRADLSGLEKEIAKLNKAYLRASMDGIEDDNLVSGVLGNLRAAQDRKRELTDKLVSLEAKALEGRGLSVKDPQDLFVEILMTWTVLTITEEDESEYVTARKRSLVSEIIRAFVERVDVEDDSASVTFRLKAELIDAPLTDIMGSLIAAERVAERVRAEREERRQRGESSLAEREIDYMEKHKKLPPRVLQRGTRRPVPDTMSEQ